MAPVKPFIIFWNLRSFFRMQERHNIGHVCFELRILKESVSGCVYVCVSMFAHLCVHISVHTCGDQRSILVVVP